MARPPWFAHDEVVRAMIINQDGSKMYLVEGAGAKKVYKIDIETATVDWTFEDPGASSCIDATLAPNENSLYVSVVHGRATSDPNYIIKINTSTGQEEQRAQTPSFWYPSGYNMPYGMVADSTFLYTGGTSYRVIAHRLSDLGMQWSTYVGSTVLSLVLSGSTLYAGDSHYDYEVRSLNTDGEELTTIYTGHQFSVQSLVYSGSVLYSGSRYHSTQDIPGIMHQHGGWTYTDLEAGVSDIAIDSAGSKIYVAGQIHSQFNDGVQAISTGGNLIWRNDGFITTRIAITPDGENLFVRGRRVGENVWGIFKLDPLTGKEFAVYDIWVKKGGIYREAELNAKRGVFRNVEGVWAKKGGTFRSV